MPTLLRLAIISSYGFFLAIMAVVCLKDNIRIWGCLTEGLGQSFSLGFSWYFICQINLQTKCWNWRHLFWHCYQHFQGKKKTVVHCKSVLSGEISCILKKLNGCEPTFGRPLPIWKVVSILKKEGAYLYFLEKTLIYILNVKRNVLIGTVINFLDYVVLSLSNCKTHWSMVPNLWFYSLKEVILSFFKEKKEHLDIYCYFFFFELSKFYQKCIFQKQSLLWSCNCCWLLKSLP